MIEKLRGERTILIVTHRPSHVRLADQVLLMDQGYLRLAGPPAEVLPKIPRGML